MAIAPSGPVKRTYGALNQVAARPPPRNIHPADEGKEAWLFLAAVSIMLQLTWGFTISFGTFREYYFRESIFAGNQSIAMIGVVSTGVIQTICPFLLHFLRGRSDTRSIFLWSGVIITVFASIGAGMSSTPIQLIMTQGVLYGLGSGLIFAPNMSMIDEWFIRRRSLAYGIYFASSSISAAILPPVLRLLLKNYSAKATLVGWGIFISVVLTSALLTVRPRLPPAEAPETAGDLNQLSGDKSSKFLVKPLFWLVILSNVMQAFSQYLPSVYIPSYATEVAGTSAENAAFLLTIYNISSAVCQPFVGILADKKGVLSPLLLSTLIPAIAVFGIWGFAKQYWSLAITCILFGGFSGGYVVLRNRFATAVVGDNNHPSQELVVSGLIMFVRGLATIGSGFIGSAVATLGEGRGLQRSEYGAGKWLPLLLTVGTFAGASSIGALGFLQNSKHSDDQKSTVDDQERALLIPK